MEDIHTLKQRRVERTKKRLKERYDYCKALGYDSIEARIMSGWAMERINKQAESDGRLTRNDTDITDVTHG